MPRTTLACRKCGCQRVHIDERARREWKTTPLGVTPVVPKAALVFDRFHLVKLMNEKLSDLRREMYHELTDNLHSKVLKGTRWLPVMSPENLKQNEKVDERAPLQEALKLNESLAFANDHTEDLRQSWNQRSKPTAQKFFEA